VRGLRSEGRLVLVDVRLNVDLHFLGLGEQHFAFRLSSTDGIDGICVLLQRVRLVGQGVRMMVSLRTRSLMCGPFLLTESSLLHEGIPGKALSSWRADSKLRWIALLDRR
jgi:hypothetical protein